MFKWLQNTSCKADTESYRGSSLVICHALFLERFFVACFYSLDGDGKCLTCQWHTWWGDKKKSSSLKSLEHCCYTRKKKFSTLYMICIKKKKNPKCGRIILRCTIILLLQGPVCNILWRLAVGGRIEDKWIFFHEWLFTVVATMSSSSSYQLSNYKLQSGHIESRQFPDSLCKYFSVISSVHLGKSCPSVYPRFLLAHLPCTSCGLCKVLKNQSALPLNAALKLNLSALALASNANKA